MKRQRTGDVKCKTDQGASFDGLLLSEPIKKAISKLGYESPSPIQWQVIPQGKIGSDLVALAKSGTGKTCAFSTIILEKFLAFQQEYCSSTSVNPSDSDSLTQDKEIEADAADNGGGDDWYPVFAIVLAPTREIAIQITSVMKQMSKFMNVSVGCFIGGTPVNRDIDLLFDGCDVVVGTPGRVLSLIEEGHMNVEELRVLVFDEVDKLLDKNTFLPEIKKVITRCSVFKQRQTIAFSATLSDEDLDFLQKKAMTNPKLFLYEPASSSSSSSSDVDQGEPQSTPVLKGVAQYYYLIDEKTDEDEEGEERKGRRRPRKELDMYTLFEIKTRALFEILDNLSFNQCVVFCNQQSLASDLADQLNEGGWSAAFSSSRVSQAQRSKIFKDFQNFNFRIIVGTDLFARGIDLERINLVVNMDLPSDPETYLHRVGRTGRFGTYGVSIAVVSRSELKLVQQISERYQVNMQKLEGQIEWSRVGEKIDSELDYSETQKSDLEKQHELYRQKYLSKNDSPSLDETSFRLQSIHISTPDTFDHYQQQHQQQNQGQQQNDGTWTGEQNYWDWNSYWAQQDHSQYAGWNSSYYPPSYNYYNSPGWNWSGYPTPPVAPVAQRKTGCASCPWCQQEQFL